MGLSNSLSWVKQILANEHLERCKAVSSLFKKYSGEGGPHTGLTQPPSQPIATAGIWQLHNWFWKPSLYEVYKCIGIFQLGYTSLNTTIVCVCECVLLGAWQIDIVRLWTKLSVVSVMSSDVTSWAPVSTISTANQRGHRQSTSNIASSCSHNMLKT